MKIAIIQYSPEWEKPLENIEKINSLLSRINNSSPDVIILPELSLTGFTMNVEKFGEEIDGISFKYFIELAVKNKADVFGGVIEKEGGKYYNTLLHVDKNGLITARYRKIHLFSFAKEDKFFTPGNSPVISQTGKSKIGLTVCYDLRFPELYRIYALRGAELIINIANWPEERIEHWELLLKANAVFSQAFVIGVNRVGNDPYNLYNGKSAIVAPDGSLINKPDEKEGITLAEINLLESHRTREKFSFLKDSKLLKRLV